MNVLQMLDDPALFAPQFRGETWTPWRSFLAALFGLPMTETEAELFRTYTGRQTLPTKQCKEAALVIGRRGGKSRILALVATYLAIAGGYERYLAPGEHAAILVIAADRAQARSIFRFTLGQFKAVPMLEAMLEGEPGFRCVRGWLRLSRQAGEADQGSG